MPSHKFELLLKELREIINILVTTCIAFAPAALASATPLPKLAKSADKIDGSMIIWLFDDIIFEES